MDEDEWGDGPDSLDLLRSFAEDGNAYCQFKLAEKLRDSGTADAEACRLYRMAAEQGHTGSQFELGMCFYSGHGTSRDIEVGARWWLIAAQAGHPVAQCCIASCYQNGDGVERNPAEALKWYLAAGTPRKDPVAPEVVHNGHPDAQSKLGEMYRTGEGVKQDRDEGMKWHRRAAEQGHAHSQFILGDAHSYGSPEDLKTSIRWF